MIREEEQKAQDTVLDFDFYSKDVWKDLNVRYRKFSGSQQCDIAGEVVESINSNIEHIVKQSGKRAICNFKTKRNGLEVLRKIGKSIALSSGDALQHEVHKEFQRSRSVEEGMMDIIEGMSAQERAAMLRWNDGRGEWKDKLPELQKLAKADFLFPDFDEVIKLLGGDRPEEEDNNQQQEDGGEQDEV